MEKSISPQLKKQISINSVANSNHIAQTLYSENFTVKFS